MFSDLGKLNLFKSVRGGPLPLPPPLAMPLIHGYNQKTYPYECVFQATISLMPISVDVLQ